MRRTLGVLAIGLLGAVLAGCGGDDDEEGASPPAAGVQGQAGLCADLALVQSALEDVLAINSSTTIQEAEEARDALNLALTELQESDSGVPTNEISSMQDAFETFDAGLDSVASDAGAANETLGDDAAALNAEAAQIEAVLTETQNSSQCPA